MIKDLFIAIAVTGLLASCSPKIFSFTAEPKTVSTKDSVILSWRARGKPTMRFDQKHIANPPGDSLNLLEFTLVVEKGSKDPAHKTQSVRLLPSLSLQFMPVRISSISGDSLIAKGITDTLLWRDYFVYSVTGTQNRRLLVTHNSITSELTDSLTSSFAWKQTPFAGGWEIKTLLNKSEIEDRSQIPERFILKVMIHKKM